MKKNNVKTKISLTLSLVLIFSLLLAACGQNSNESTSGESSEKRGTIIWLSNLSSGVQYEGTINYLNKLGEELGYTFKVVYGDSFNDPAGNLNAIRNGMTNDVVGIIVSQDGGLKDIMQAYPNLYVVGYNNDMRSVFHEGGANSEVLGNEKFLGTIVDGYKDGALLGQQYARKVIENQYKKVSVVIFPGYAYPNLSEANVSFREVIEQHNANASEEQQVEIVGETKVLEFTPLENSYFLENGHSELDAIVGFLAGTDFIYPALKAAIANGSVNANVKLLTAGFNTNEEIVADIGGEGVIQFISIAPGENVAWSLAMLDAALLGKPYNDFSGAEAVDSLPYEITSPEDIQNVITKGFTGTADVSLVQISFDELKKVMPRYSSDATYSTLKALFQSEQLSVEALKNR